LKKRLFDYLTGKFPGHKSAHFLLRLAAAFTKNWIKVQIGLQAIFAAEFGGNFGRF